MEVALQSLQHHRASLLPTCKRKKRRHLPGMLRYRRRERSVASCRKAKEMEASALLLVETEQPFRMAIVHKKGVCKEPETMEQAIRFSATRKKQATKKNSVVANCRK